MNSSEVLNKAKEIFSTLSSDDYRFDRAVFIRTKDGTTLFYQESFAEQDGEWWMVFTKNFGFVIFHSSNLIDGKIKEFVEI